MVAKKRIAGKNRRKPVTCVKHAVSVALTRLTASATIWHFFQPTFATLLFIATLRIVTRHFLDGHTTVVNFYGQQCLLEYIIVVL